jgi:hypothetical protein
MIIIAVLYVGCHRGTSCLWRLAGMNSTDTSGSSMLTRIQCVAGKYSSVEGATGGSDCTVREAGTYSAVEGAASISECERCEAGKWRA